MTQTATLDLSIQAAMSALDSRSIAPPELFVSMATGVDLLPERLDRSEVVELAELEAVPDAWSAGRLFIGRLGELNVWLLEDLGMEAAAREGAASFDAGWPCWLAARAGAAFMIHTSAGAALDGELPRGTLCALSDHINLSGTTPLIGLAQSQLGPMFPDVSMLHDSRLRAAARTVAERQGLPLAEVVGACSVGPSLTTAAERAFYQRAGARVDVQGLAAPLLAAAHAGLRALSLVVVVEEPGETLDLRRLLAGAEAAAPVLEELIMGLAPDIAGYAAELADEL